MNPFINPTQSDTKSRGAEDEQDDESWGFKARSSPASARCGMSSIIALWAQIENITGSIHSPQTQWMVFISNHILLFG